LGLERLRAEELADPSGLAKVSDGSDDDGGGGGDNDDEDGQSRGPTRRGRYRRHRLKSSPYEFSSPFFPPLICKG